MEWFGLEGSLENTQFQAPFHRQGLCHLKFLYIIREKCKQILFFPEHSRLSAALLLGLIPAALSQTDAPSVPSLPSPKFPCQSPPHLSPDFTPCSPWSQAEALGAPWSFNLSFWMFKHPPCFPTGMKLQLPLLLGAHFLPDTAISWLDLK